LPGAIDAILTREILPTPLSDKETVKDRDCGVKKPSTARRPAGNRADAGAGLRNPGASERVSNGDSMSVLIYTVLTVAIFALLGLVQKLVERL
jgi:hypothetical protein